jgi:hypothetical protein
MLYVLTKKKILEMILFLQCVVRCILFRKIWRVFGSVVVVIFNIAFRAEIHVNNFFLFFKNHFWYQHIKTIQKVQTALNFNKKKIEIRSKTSSIIEPNMLMIMLRNQLPLFVLDRLLGVWDFSLIILIRKD